MIKKKTEKIQPKHTDDDLKRYLGSLKEHFDDRFDAVIEQFGGMNRKLDSHTEMIARIMMQLEEVKSEMRQKVDLQQFSRLEKRVALLESKRR